jgi:hypothetical protein
MRKHQGIFICFPSYAFSGLCADGDPIGKNKSRFFVTCGEFDNSYRKPLDFAFYCANNADID